MRILVAEMFLTVEVLPIQPEVRRAVGGQDKGHLLGRGRHDLSVGPGPQVVTAWVKGREVHKVIVQATVVTPGQLCIAYLEGAPLHGCLMDLRDAPVIVTRDLEPIVLSLEAIQVRNANGIWPSYEPVMDVALLELVFQAILQGTPSWYKSLLKNGTQASAGLAR